VPTSPTEKTKLVRKLPAGSRGPERTPAPPTLDPAKLPPIPARAPDSTVVMSASSEHPIDPMPTIETTPLPKRPPRISRRESIVFAVGATLGAVLAFVASFLALQSREDPSHTPEGTGGKRKKSAP
jgi:hypothetical protein